MDLFVILSNYMDQFSNFLFLIPQSLLFGLLMRISHKSVNTYMFCLYIGTCVRVYSIDAIQIEEVQSTVNGPKLDIYI